jgi:large subunit ribosomal protein L31e
LRACRVFWYTAPAQTLATLLPHNLRRWLVLSSIQGTRDVRLDPQLNKKVWECGIKGVPFRLRVRISRKRNDEEGAKEKLYSYVQAVNVKDPKGLQTTVVEDA